MEKEDDALVTFSPLSISNKKKAKIKTKETNPKHLQRYSSRSEDEQAPLIVSTAEDSSAKNNTCYEDRFFHVQPQAKSQLWIADILEVMLLYVSADIKTLLAVSHVCQAWRERGEHLPQWREIKVVDWSDRFFMEEIRPPQAIHTRSDYIARKRWDENHRRRMLELRKRKKNQAMISKIKKAICLWVIYAILLCSLLGLSFWIGHSRVPAFNSDSKIGIYQSLLCFFIFLLIAFIILTTNSLKRWNMFSGHDRVGLTMQNLTLYLFLIAVPVGTVFALLSARYSWAGVLDAMPLYDASIHATAASCAHNTLHYGPQPVNDSFRATPFYVKIPKNELSLWQPVGTVVYPLSDDDGSHLSHRLKAANATSIFFFRNNITSCNNTWPQIAFATIHQDSHHSSVAHLLSSAQWQMYLNWSKSSDIYFRVPQFAEYFEVRKNELKLGWRWYHHADKNSFWVHGRIPLAELDLGTQISPSQTLSRYQYSTFIFFVCCISGFVFLSFGFVMPENFWKVCLVVLLGIFVVIWNPVTAVIVGYVCGSEDQPDWCYISRGNAQRLEVYGIIFTGLVVFRLVWYWCKRR